MSTTDWHGARVLVTGARGFIAAHLCRRLIQSGALVHGVSSRADVEAVSGLQWLQTDLTDLAAVRTVIARVAPDVVFHLAGHVTGSQELAQVEPTFASNLASTVHLLTAVAETGRSRVVLAGSMQEPDQDEPAGVPCSPYAASKWAGGAYARMFQALYGQRIVIARPMMVYGPGQWDLAKLLPYVTTSLLAGTSPAISSGRRELDWVFVDDVVDGLMTIALSSTIDGRTIDLGSGTLTSVRAIVDQVVALVDSGVPVRFDALADRPFERPRAARVEETARLTGWVAATPLGEGLSRTVAWYREKWCSPKPA
jgi:nucleoside-diphosphate-sugar epimerase